jgi:hypothetical protein
VLYRLRGIRKTQLVLKYIRLYKEKYTAIFWLNMNNNNSLRLSFRDITIEVLKYYLSNNILVSIDLEGNIDLIVNIVKA